LPAAGFRGGTLAVNRFQGGFRPGFRHHRRFPFAVAAVGLGLGYGYYNDYYDYGYGYDDPYYYGDGGCYIVRRSVLTPYGWRIRSVQVCG
jgi:1,4-dihydroxy-2-naphthoate octaprenyltransferase